MYAFQSWASSSCVTKNALNFFFLKGHNIGFLEKAGTMLFDEANPSM